MPRKIVREFDTRKNIGPRRNPIGRRGGPKIEAYNGLKKLITENRKMDGRKVSLASNAAELAGNKKVFVIASNEIQRIEKDELSLTPLGKIIERDEPLKMIYVNRRVGEPERRKENRQMKKKEE